MASQKTVTASLQEDRGNWVVRGRVFDPETGVIRQRSKSTKLPVKGNNKRKAELLMRDIINEWTNEANGLIKSESPLFSVYVHKWLDRKKNLRIKANTIKSYTDYIKVHIDPNLGQLPIRSITLQDLERFYGEYLQTHTVNSARKVHVVVSGAFKEAIRDGIIQSNIALNVEFPNAEKFTGAAVYNEKQVAKLLAEAKEIGEPILAALTLALYYGLRRSEVLGLRWEDIDFENKIMTVSNTVVQNGDLRIEAESTKTKKSHRSIGLISATIPYLQALKEKQNDSGLVLDKVCVWPDGSPVRPDYVTRKANQIMKKCSLPTIRFHDLRHTVASILAPHVTPKQLQEFLGHEDISTTLGIYTHILDDQRKATSDTMDSLLGNTAISF